MVNVALDFIIGLVPGAEAIYRGNTRNALLLEDFLRERAEKNLRKTGQLPERAVTSGSHRERKGRDVRRQESAAHRDQRQYEKDIAALDESPDRRRSSKKRFGW